MKYNKEKSNPKLCNLKKLYQILLLACLLPLINSCTSIPKYDQIQGGYWEARSLIKDKKNSKTYLVNIDFYSQKPNSLRVDVTTPIGIHVISLAQHEKKMTYIIPQKKLYYKGALSNQVFTELISYPLDTNLMFDILFDQAIVKKGWSCQKDLKGFVEKCENKNQQLKVEWFQRKGKERTVEITHPFFEMQLQFHNFEPMNSFKEKTFEISKPTGFRQL